MDHPSAEQHALSNELKTEGTKSLVPTRDNENLETLSVARLIG
jgi:hypothetical protein